jgi:hypothetical protein
MAMLAQLQDRLDQIYRTARIHDVRDFLVTDPNYAEALGQGTMLKGTDETLLMTQLDGELAVALYLNRDLLERLESSEPLVRLQSGLLQDLWTVLEGISHFNYVVWKATQDREVSLLELELQAEIDKFVGTVRLAAEQGDRYVLRSIHRWLFEDVSFRTDLNAEQRARYQSANAYAGRFCHQLGNRLEAGDELAMSRLRAFYRLPMTDKISHIHSAAWA